MTVVKIRCPCCEGSGQIDEAVPENILSLLQREIYKMVRDSKNGVRTSQLVDRLYSDRYDGGPDGANDVVRVTIYNLNKRLALVNECIKANRGPGAVYKLHTNIL